MNTPTREATLPPPAPRNSLDAALVRGIAWTGAVKWVSQGVRWASTVLVARILMPEDYGLVGMALVYTGLVLLLSEFGLGAAIVRLRQLSHEQISQLNGLSVLIGLGGFLLSCGMAVPVGRFFNDPRVPLVVVVISTTFVITSFRTVPHALLQRDLRFKALALFDGAAGILVAVATLICALLGFGYWALVLAELTNAALLTLFAILLRPHGLGWPRAAAIRQAVTFSWHIIVSRIAWYLYSNADFAVAGRLLGQAALGFYSFAWTLGGMVVGQVTSLIVRITPSIFSAVQDDPAALRRYLLNITEGIAILTVPASVGLCLVADDFVLVVLGDQWAGAIGPLRLLAIYAVLRSISPLIPQVLIMVGEERYQARISVLSAVILPTAFLVGSRWGVNGIAAAWIAVHPFLLMPLYHRAASKIGMTAAHYLRALWPSCSSSILMAAAVWGVQLGAPDLWPAAAHLGLQVSIGAAVYTGAMLSFHRERSRAFYRTLRLVRGER